MCPTDPRIIIIQFKFQEDSSQCSPPWSGQQELQDPMKQQKHFADMNGHYWTTHSHFLNPSFSWSSSDRPSSLSKDKCTNQIKQFTKQSCECIRMCGVQNQNSIRISDTKKKHVLPLFVICCRQQKHTGRKSKKFCRNDNKKEME
jgi:hypothetical protein